MYIFDIFFSKWSTYMDVLRNIFIWLNQRKELPQIDRRAHSFHSKDSKFWGTMRNDQRYLLTHMVRFALLEFVFHWAIKTMGHLDGSSVSEVRKSYYCLLGVSWRVCAVSNNFKLFCFGRRKLIRTLQAGDSAITKISFKSVFWWYQKLATLTETELKDSFWTWLCWTP